jgi:hypothetical protein
LSRRPTLSFGFYFEPIAYRDVNGIDKMGLM